MNQMLSQIRFQGLRHRLGFAKWPELRQVADEALNADIYTPSLVDAALDAGEWLHEIGAAFEKALEELEINLPQSEDSCCWALLHHHVSQISTGLITPWAGLEGVMEVYYGCRIQCTNYVGDSHDIHELIGAYWQYDELLECREEVTYKDPGGAVITTGVVGTVDSDDFTHRNFSKEDVIALLELDRSVVEICKLWLERHAGRYVEVHETDLDSGNFCGTKQ
jgi:hypothetical protein